MKARLIAGTHYARVDGRLKAYRAGDTVSLTDREFRAFAGKFEPLAEPKADKGKKAAKADKPKADKDPDAKADD